MILYNLTGGDINKYREILKTPVIVAFEYLEINLIEQDKLLKKRR